MPTPPRTFISYSHDSDAHKGWVLALATRLLANGADVILDRWNLRLGSNVAFFMEGGLTEADRVLAICSSAYVEKANQGRGGVGYEKMILTAQLMENLHSDRVIPILRANPAGNLPTFLSGRLYDDFRDDNQYEARYGELIREILGEQVIPRPPIGANPFAHDQFPALAFSRERYVMPDLSGTVTFDYSSNNGSYVVGLGDLAFETKWSAAGVNSIYAYTDGANIQSIALAVGVRELAALGDASSFDNSSRVRNPQAGEIVVWRNRSGYYMATRVESVSVRHLHLHVAHLVFTYVIQPDRTPVFNR